MTNGNGVTYTNIPIHSNGHNDNYQNNNNNIDRSVYEKDILWHILLSNIYFLNLKRFRDFDQHLKFLYICDLNFQLQSKQKKPEHQTSQ